MGMPMLHGRTRGYEMISARYRIKILYWYIRQSTQIVSEIIIGTIGTQTGTQVFR